MSDVPEITNKMKAECHGEFSYTKVVSCEQCAIEGENESCDCCEGSGEYIKTFEIPWDSCKDIYKAMYKHSPLPKKITTLEQRIKQLEEASSWIPVSEKRQCLDDDLFIYRDAHLPIVNGYCHNSIFRDYTGNIMNGVSFYKPATPPKQINPPSEVRE